MFQLRRYDTIIFTLSVWLHKYIHQPYQTSSFHVTSVMSHMISKVTKMIFKQIFTCFKLLISKTKNTLNLQFFVLAFKKFRFQPPPPPPPSSTEGALCPLRRHTACSTACCWTVCINYLFKKHHLICTLDPPLLIIYYTIYKSLINHKLTKLI